MTNANNLNSSWAQDVLKQYNSTSIPTTMLRVMERLQGAADIRPKEDTGRNQIKASGTHAFATTDTTIKLGSTDLTMTVRDLYILPDIRNASTKMRKAYTMPSYIKAGHVIIQGSADNDKINVSQDSKGNTLLRVQQEGKEAQFNLGHIAAITINSGDGKDQITLSANNYFGGITVNGGAGNDQINIDAENTLLNGINVQGGDGSDIVKLAGKSGKLEIDGGGGNDLIHATKFEGDLNLQRVLYGGIGNDILVGTLFNDSLNGGSGNDRIHGSGGEDQISGGAGNDILYGSGVLHGDEGDDTLSSEDGAIRGGAGNDYLYGTSQTRFHGGEGTDNFVLGTLLPYTLYATGADATHLQVQDRDVSRLQTRVPESAINAYKTNLGDYNAANDYLVDRNRLV